MMRAYFGTMCLNFDPSSAVIKFQIKTTAYVIFYRYFEKMNLGRAGSQMPGGPLVAQTGRAGRKLLVLRFAGQGVVEFGVVDDIAQ